MELRPRLSETSVPSPPGGPDGVVLVLHGGASRGEQMMVSPTQLSVLRMIPIATRVARRSRGRLAVFRLLNSRRGWDTRHTPVRDVEWALGELRERFGGPLPTCLVGHSLGGRAALLSAYRPEVVSAVALAPWVYPTDGLEPPLDLSGRRLLFVHGLRDRIADPTAAAAVARTLARTADVGFVRIPDGKHGMLRHHAQFDGYAADFAAATLLGDDVGAIATPVSQVLSGARWVDA